MRHTTVMANDRERERQKRTDVRACACSDVKVVLRYGTELQRERTLVKLQRVPM